MSNLALLWTPGARACSGVLLILCGSESKGEPLVAGMWLSLILKRRVLRESASVGLGSVEVSFSSWHCPARGCHLGLHG